MPKKPSLRNIEFCGTVIPYILAEYVAEPSPPNSEAVHKSKNVLPEFPLKNAADLQLFELDCMVEKNLVQLLKNKFLEIGRVDVPKFIRGNLRNFLTDEAALPYSWHGHRGNIAVCDFVSMETLIDSCQQHFNQSDTTEIVKTIKLWFQYASDRIKKRSSNNV